MFQANDEQQEADTRRRVEGVKVFCCCWKVKVFWQQKIKTYIKLRVEGIKVFWQQTIKNLYQTNELRESRFFATKNKNLYQTCSGFRNRDYNDNWSANNRLLDNRLVSTTYIYTFIKILIKLAIVLIMRILTLDDVHVLFTWQRMIFR